MTPQEKQQLPFKSQLSHFQAKSWDSWQCSRNGRARLIFMKQHRFQYPSMAVQIIVLLQLFLLSNQVFNFSILAKSSVENYISFLNLAFTQQLQPEKFSPLCTPGAVTIEQVQRVTTEQAAFQQQVRNHSCLPDPKSHGPYCVNIRHYYLHSPHGITSWNLLLLFGTQIETLWPYMNTKPA